MTRVCPDCGRQGLEYNPKTRVLWCLYVECNFRRVGVDEQTAAEHLRKRDVGYLVGWTYEQNRGKTYPYCPP